MKGARTYIIALAILGIILITSKVSAAALIAEFEGLRLNAYQDSGGVWTIGYGTTINPVTGLPIKKGDKITKDTALTWLRMQTAATEGQVKAKLKVKQNDRQISALTSLAYNIGLGAFGRSTLLRLINTGAKPNEIAAQFIRWNKVKGKEVPGLTRRRQLEAELYLS
jgi:GH24 family phage-related lysozyme (muramidase)